MSADKIWAEAVKEKILNKMVCVRERNHGKLPYTTDLNGRYDDKSDKKIAYGPDDGLNWWTNGFWGGILWLMYEESPNKADKSLYKSSARMCLQMLSATLDSYTGLHHDVGFMFMPTAVMQYRLTGDDRAKDIALHAANILAGRFNIAGGFIRAWNDIPGCDTKGWAIIDCMFNITLLYWASKITDDPRYKQIAMAHADTVMEHFIRADGSSIHIGEFNPYTGEYICNHAGQGYSTSSAWSRGQGWALYGFTLSYLHSKKEEYLTTACRVADYCLSQISDTYIIPSDFKKKGEGNIEDSCAACVIAGGLIELSTVTKNGKSQTYLSTAVNILKALDENRNDYSEKTDAIVTGCSAAYHSNQHNITMNYADYFFIEAIWKLTDTTTETW
ncbi:MAG: glycoside hydrolase family 88 protein [Lachnospiraceae bacterium]|nr:glycoside hydrolase family 88 protein [Lachnospiraceae bacterium]